VINAGTGTTHGTDEDQATVNYEGRLINGNVFDSSYTRGKPSAFRVNGVVKGAQKMFPVMKVILISLAF